MNTLVIAGLLLLVLLVLAIFWSRHRQQKRLPYVVQETLCKPTQRAFLTALEQAVGEQGRVFARVPLAVVLAPANGMSKSKCQQASARLAAREVDYLICHPADLSFICAIELDEEGHRHHKRAARDSFLKLACESAGLPLLSIPASAHYSQEELQAQIVPLLSKPALPEPDDHLPGTRREPTFNPLLLDGLGVEEQGAERGHARVTMSVEVSDDTDEAQPENLFEDESPESLPHCPRCDALLQEREARKGPHAGKLFMACSRFPECRYAVPLPPRA